MSRLFGFNQKLVTEVDISTLDTVDLRGLQPRAKGNNWAAKIRSVTSASESTATASTEASAEKQFGKGCEGHDGRGYGGGHDRAWNRGRDPIQNSILHGQRITPHSASQT